MRVYPLSYRLQTARFCFMAVAAALVAGCAQDDFGSPEGLRRAEQQRAISETALNAQIMSDRAREQRCERDPTRREC